MRRRERAVLATVAVVAAAIATCALFICRELPRVEEALEEASPTFEVPDAAPPTVVVDDAAPEARADPGSRRLSVGRSYRRRGLAPRWTLRPPERVRPPAARRHERKETPREPWAPGPEELPR
jgi:hypothetical protein